MRKLIFLGTGTSQGVPIIGCDCEVCRSNDPRDKRLRTSALICTDSTQVVIDAGPDFRYQMLRERSKGSIKDRLDGVVLTHSHHDHIGGLDDVRPYLHIMRKPIALYGSRDTLRHVTDEAFRYAFVENPYPGAPRFEVHVVGSAAGGNNDDIACTDVDVDNSATVNADIGVDVNTGVDNDTAVNADVDAVQSIMGVTGAAGATDTAGAKIFTVGNITFQPVEVLHNTDLSILGYRIDNLAYLTDVKFIPAESIKKLQGIRVMVINALRGWRHPSHLSLPEALEIIAYIKPQIAYLTHISHRLGLYEEVIKQLPKNVLPAYDGLSVDF
ncbi:MAG: MBL fold metallo-hydrolase [Bacteroidales bacterium]|jgi:phosphoribosyl 1,2-cyclic phosphate phosphodiesterase|nr:MBL fold metallo-hydrolase [Bacteroidales bacterium]